MFLSFRSNAAAVKPDKLFMAPCLLFVADLEFSISLSSH